MQGEILEQRSKRLDGEGEDVVRAGLGPATGEATVALARRTRALDVSPRLGLALRAGNPAGVELGLSAVHWPRPLRGHLGFGLEATWSVLSRRDDLSAGGVPVSLETRADFFGLAAVALLRQDLGPGLLGWVDLGGGLALASTRLTQPGLPAIGATAWVPLLHGALALGLRSGPFLEARAAWQGDAHSEALQGSLLTFTLSAGWRLETL